MDKERGNPWAGFAGRAVIAPSLLACDFAHVGRQIDQVLDAGADVIHADVMDGHFVTNLSIGPPVVKSIREYTEAVLDVHIMVADPAYYIERFADVGADSVTFHIEATDDAAGLVGRLRACGLGVGVSVRPATPASALSEIIESVDLVLVMTVEPGYGGQAFMYDMLEKITAVRSMLRPEQRLQVDGGIDADTIVKCANAGADVFVAGSSIFGDDDVARAIGDLRRAVGCR
ncbi:MAG: ribulose-phosphate 3-epimerase [Phycisphaerae bacterium]|jgi:ribulose-phosphate 3-epimerase|nr:ribulose-phosphate 3-epimerase [Phycisphaerae bacterium]MDP7289709.1 ribulose-phosphate 3-epimerase [Phycisphaerae bacterium]